MQRVDLRVDLPKSRVGEAGLREGTVAESRSESRLVDSSALCRGQTIQADCRPSSARPLRAPA